MVETSPIQHVIWCDRNLWSSNPWYLHYPRILSFLHIYGTETENGPRLTEDFHIELFQKLGFHRIRTAARQKKTLLFLRFEGKKSAQRHVFTWRNCHISLRFTFCPRPRTHTQGSVSRTEPEESYSKYHISNEYVSSILSSGLAFNIKERVSLIESSRTAKSARSSTSWTTSSIQMLPVREDDRLQVVTLFCLP